MIIKVNSTTSRGGSLENDRFEITGQGVRSASDGANSSDIYEVFVLDGPVVTIDDAAGSADVLVLQSASTTGASRFINPNAITFSRQGDDLGVVVRGINSSIVIKGYYTGGRIETILAGSDGDTVVKVPVLLQVPPPKLPIKPRSLGVEGAETTSARQLVQAMAGFAAPAAGHSVSALTAAKPQFDLAVASV